MVCISGVLLNNTNVNGDLCDDGDPLTDADVCQNGECSGEPTCRDVPTAPACQICDNRVYVVDDTCQNRWYLDDDDPSLNKLLCLGCPECHICQNGNCSSEAADGMNCDDGDSGTFHDTCSNGTCTGDECLVYCHDYGSCQIQNDMIQPCCQVGNCTQVNTTEPTCQGGNCDQTNSTDCVCLGPGACSQYNCTNPYCPAENCPGNCDNMDCGQCNYCELGYCYTNFTMNGQICVNDELVDAVCDNGACVGTPEGCSTDQGEYSCNPCEMCGETGQGQFSCLPNPEVEDDPCLDGFGGTGQCIEGVCTPAFQILDQIVVNFGLQQSDPQSGNADVTLGGIVRVVSPWFLVDNPQMQVVSEWPVDGPGTFEITEDCDATGYYCVQRWEVKYTVGKICDVATRYALQFLGANRNQPDDPPATYWYEVTIAQKAVCGVVIRDVPLKGGIDVCSDDTCAGPTDERVFRLGARVYLNFWASGLAPIEAFDCTEMHLQIASDNPMYVLTEPPDAAKPIDVNLLAAVGGLGIQKGYYQDIAAWTTDAETGCTMQWSIILANSYFAVVVAEFFKISLDVKVQYLQGARRALADGSIIEPESQYFYYFMEKEVKRSGVPTGEVARRPYFYSPSYRRYLQTPEEEFNYQFDHQFTVVPFRCTSDYDAWGVEVGSYAATPCDNGENLFMRYCDIDGWNDELNKNLCGDVVVPSDGAIEAEQETSGGMLWLLVIVNACAFVLICSICFLICDRYRRKKARVKVVAMPDNGKVKKGKSLKSSTKKPRPVVSELSLNTKKKSTREGTGDKPDAKKAPAKKPVEHAQLFE